MQPDAECTCRVRYEDMPELGVRLDDHGGWIIKAISAINSKGRPSSGAALDAGSRAAALQAFAGFCSTVCKHAKSGFGSSGKPKAALKRILQAADRCPTSPTNAPSCHCASRKWMENRTSAVQGAVHSAPPAHSLSVQFKLKHSALQSSD